jgi:hypothetical protein
MSKISSIILLISVVVVIMLIFSIYFYFVFFKNETADLFLTPTQNSTEKTEQVIKPPDPGVELARLQNDYPEIITGIIKFLDTKNSYKTTLAASDGKEYMLWPAQPASVYQSLGIKNGDKVQVNGKIFEDDKLTWALIKPI